MKKVCKCKEVLKVHVKLRYFIAFFWTLHIESYKRLHVIKDILSESFWTTLLEVYKGLWLLETLLSLIHCRNPVYSSLLPFKIFTETFESLQMILSCFVYVFNVFVLGQTLMIWFLNHWWRLASPENYKGWIRKPLTGSDMHADMENNEPIGANNTGPPE